MGNKLGIREAVVTGALLAAAVAPAVAWGLGLGQIQSDTRIGQPFRARIPILAANTADLQGLRVALATPAAYQRAGMAEPDFLFDLKFSVHQGANGPYVLVTSQQPTRLPFLNIMVHASWSSGEVTRQYTVLLNPPVFAAGTSGAAVSAPNLPVARKAAAVPPTTRTVPLPPAHSAPQPAVAQQPQPQAMPAVTPPPAAAQVHSYGPVARGATLWGLAHQLRPDRSISINQMMIALYRANPDAFVGNINRLKAGYVLRVPSRGDLEAVSAVEATRTVARQDAEWQQAKSMVATQTRPLAPAAPATAAAETTASAAAAQVAAAETAGATAATAGRVLLTTPEVTASQAAAAPGTATGTVVAGAAGVAALAAATTSGGGAAGGTGASVGGPAKIKSNALASLAATKAPGAAAPAASAASRSVAPPAPKASKKANARTSVNSVNSVSSPPVEATPWWQDWLSSPPGWIAAGGVGLVLLASLLLIVRRRRAAAGGVPAADRVADKGPGSGAADTAAGGEDAAETKTSAGADGSDSSEEELGTETYIGGPAPEIDQGDAVAEAEFHAGYGEYDEAVRILRGALERQPERQELRRKLLEVLFAAGDATAFRTEAEAYRETVAENSEEWSDVAVMGRRLLPDEALFAEAGAPADKSASDQKKAESLDFDMELDRLSGTASADNSQNEFERTMDELSTFIETYVPGSGDTPLDLQLPPQETPQPNAGADAAEGDDDALEFNPEEESPAEPGSGSQEPGQTAGAVAGGGEAETLTDENVVDTKLDLARAYIDMGDPESARSVLEEVIDEGDETQRGEAKRLLDSLS